MERLCADDLEDEAADQGLGFLVPMRIGRLARQIVDQGIDQQSGVLVQIEALRMRAIEEIDAPLRDQALLAALTEPPKSVSARTGDYPSRGGVAARRGR